MAGNLKAAELRRLLAKGEFILAPGIYDGISARVADGMGFPALYMTGYGATASMLGLPDAGLATYSDMVGRAEMICSVVKTPLIADADTGYGGLLNVQRTVRGYEAAGVAATRIFITISSAGTTRRPGVWPHFLGISWSSIWIAATPAAS